ncbi:hypothetical protein LdCL_340034000 [Leishmania donovani]|uniref:Uncharacterized protein n=1 Tax=Leishmania donovani TaxID=5661 RepID=A0A3Q8IHD1_LEIDO|nr:hypothetical protein LdCL_340034000 [Leishmania donovani]
MAESAPRCKVRVPRAASPQALTTWPRQRRRCGSAPGGASVLFVWSCKGRVAHRRTYPGRFAARTLCVRVPPAGATTIDVAACGRDASNDDDAAIVNRGRGALPVEGRSPGWRRGAGFGRCFTG